MTRIGLVGCGRWGRNAARAMAKAGVLAWVADCSFSSAAVLANEHGVPKSLVRDADWSGVDAVWICTPIETHELLVHDALSRGKHVLCEKPLARTKAQAEMLADEAKRAGVVLMADHTWLGHAGVRAVVAPPIHDYEAMRFAQDARGFDAIEDLLPHDVALMRHGLGKNIARVKWTEFDQSIELECDDDGGRWLECVYSYSAPTKARVVRSWSSSDGYRLNDGSLPEGAPEPLTVILSEFLSAVAERREPTIGSAAEFIHVAAVIEAAKESRRRGGEWVDVV